MEVLIPVIIWLIFIFGIASNRAKVQTRYVNEKAIKEKAVEVANSKPVNPTPATAKVAKAKQVFAKPTAEKTHEHKGEVAEAVLLEDRKNDWLARQIKEEARIGSRPFN